MKPLSRLPLGAFLSGLSAAICAIPTLVLPADSPNAPKVGLLAVAAVMFAVAVVRVRTERGAAPAGGSESDGEPTR